MRAMLTRRPVLGVLAGLAAAPAACTTWPAPTVPMPVRRIAARCAVRSRCALLPGVASRADDFVGEGFVADLQSAAPSCELLLADAHLGYFVEGQLLRRLREDVVRPSGGPRASNGAAPVAHLPDSSTASRDSDVSNVPNVGGVPNARNAPQGPSSATATDAATGPRPWLVGISLGGLAALAYATRYGSEIAGVFAIAPYLGRRELLRDIAAAGGPLAWSLQPATPGVPSEPHAAIEDELWRWLARPGIGNAGPPVHLGYGRDDRFVDAQRVLRSLLPAGHTDVVDGGHDWPAWRALWQRWLQRGLLGGPTAGCGSTA